MTRKLGIAVVLVAASLLLWGIIGLIIYLGYGAAS